MEYAATTLTKRVIACLDVASGRVVKGVNFVNLRDAGDPVELAAYYSSQGVDELVLLDITASTEGRGPLLELIRRATERVFIPVTVGGGISTLEDIRDLLSAGTDKVSINSAAVADPTLITRSALAYGSQCIVVAIDARRTGAGVAQEPSGQPGPATEVTGDKEQSPPARAGIRIYKGGTLRREASQMLPATSVAGQPALSNTGATSSGWEVFTHGGRRPTGLDAVEWARQVAELGAGEILLTSMDKDGTQNGYDLPLTAAISRTVTIPVIASGGAGNPGHMADVLTEGCADAALAASIFHDGTFTIREAKEQLAALGIEVRL